MPFLTISQVRYDSCILEWIMIHVWHSDAFKVQWKHSLFCVYHTTHGIIQTQEHLSLDLSRSLSNSSTFLGLSGGWPHRDKESNMSEQERYVLRTWLMKGFGGRNWGRRHFLLVFAVWRWLGWRAAAPWLWIKFSYRQKFTDSL